MSLSEIMDAARGITNMYLAHEIAVDKDFMLQNLKEGQQQNPIEAQVTVVITLLLDRTKTNLVLQVKKIVHQAFWDVLAAQLNEDPPEYSHALSLLAEVKQAILNLLMPQQKRLIDR